ncbi:hypothetical protein JCM19232_879 [Vibrio ishigakensis]|uniref:Uncharacterized protein n=1 Tax=Vibrio ishigakensis TaxID=1481914 RepID=A0A0B8P2U3_9VIBR|nr:hypothetical protein JCM19232_879 [Vibrio ishigakensis]
MFILSIVLLIISAYLYDAGEAFVAVEVGIIHYLFCLKFSSSESAVKGSLIPFLTTLIAVPLSLVAMPWAPLTTAIFTFVLVLFERDSHHQSVPKYILPLTFLLLSMMMVPSNVEPIALMTQRAVSVILGIVVAIIAATIVWPNPESGSEQAKQAYKLNKVDLKYSVRKALGVGLILCLGLIGGSGAALGAYLFMMIHSPLTKNLAPKAWERLSGTVLGALIYVPLGLMLGYMDSPLVVSVITWSLVIVSLYMILVYLEHNYTVATAFIMLLILAVSVGPFNSEVVEAVLMPRLWFTIVGGVSMIILGLLIPLREAELQ